MAAYRITASSSLPVRYSCVCQHCGRQVTQKSAVPVQHVVYARGGQSVSQSGLIDELSADREFTKQYLNDLIRIQREATDKDPKTKRHVYRNHRPKLSNVCPH